MHDRCSSVNKDGTACSGRPLPGKDRCAWYDPQMQQRVAAGRVQGGKAKSNAARAKKQLPAEAMTLDEIRGALSVALKGVLTGRLEPGVGNAVAALGRALVTVTEASDLERRLSELELAAGIGGKTA